MILGGAAATWGERIGNRIGDGEYFQDLSLVKSTYVTLKLGF